MRVHTLFIITNYEITDSKKKKQKAGNPIQYKVETTGLEKVTIFSGIHHIPKYSRLLPNLAAQEEKDEQ